MKIIDKWLLFKYVDGQLTPLSKPIKTKAAAEKARLKLHDRDLIKFTDRGVLNGERVSSNFDAHTVYVGFRDAQAAQRFAKAWKHAIDLCGGKLSAF